jgi:uncharacterized membrane protein
VRKNLHYLWLLISLVLGLTLLTYQLDAKSFWCDELFTIHMANNSAKEILSEVAADLHPPLYFLGIRGWTEIVGMSERSLRLLSVLFAISALWFTWQLGIQIVGRRAAQIGVIALACSPLFIEFSRMARYYSMALALGVLATLMFVNGLQRNRQLDWIAYVIACTLLLYTFYLSTTLILAHGLFLGLSRQVTRSQRRKWLMSILIAFIAFAPWFPVIFEGQMSRASWHKADYAGSVKGLALSVIYPFYAFGVGETIFPWFPTAIPAAIAVLGLNIWWLSKDRGRWRWLMLSLIFLPVLLTSLVTVFISTATPFLNVPVRSLFILPYFALTLGAGWVALSRLSWRIALGGLIGITWTFALFNYYTGRQFINPIYIIPARQISYQVASQTGPHDVVVGEVDSGFSYYYYKRPERKAPYFEASQTASIIDYISTHPVDKVWLITLGRDGTRDLTPRDIMHWLGKNFSLTLEQGYDEQDPIYRQVKEFLLHRPAYRYKVLVQRYEQKP